MRKPWRSSSPRDLAAREDAVRLHLAAERRGRPPPYRPAARRCWRRRDSRRRAGVSGHAAQLANRPPPVGNVHQQAEADDRVERAVRETPARARRLRQSRWPGPLRRRARRATPSISLDASTPVTRAPRLASAIAARPVPVPRSRTCSLLDVARETRKRTRS